MYERSARGFDELDREGTQRRGVVHRLGDRLAHVLVAERLFARSKYVVMMCGPTRARVRPTRLQRLDLVVGDLWRQGDVTGLQAGDDGGAVENLEMKHVEVRQPLLPVVGEPFELDVGAARADEAEGVCPDGNRRRLLLANLVEVGLRRIAPGGQ